MGIELMLDRVVVIDNIEEEITDFVRVLRGYDISVDEHLLTDDYTQLPVYTRNRQLIFIDLMLDEDESHLLTNISRIIAIISRIVGDGFGPYGLVIWTKHTDKINQLMKRFDSVSKEQTQQNNNDNEFGDEISTNISLPNPPLFVIGIDKVQFKSSGKWDFSGLIPILNKEIQKSNASYFFLRWLSVTRQAAQDSILNVYGLTREYENKDSEITYILSKLAYNQTGINHFYPGLTADAYKAFSDVIHPMINALTASETIPDLSSISSSYTIDEELPILAKLNSILFIDDIGIEQNEIMPGNVYEIKDTRSPAIVKQNERICLKKKKTPTSTKLEDYKNYDCTPIAIELTPPCDFSNKKILSRMVGGYIIDFSANEDPNYKRLQSGDKNYVIFPIVIPGSNNPKYVIFDFRHLFSPSDESLKDASKYKILFRVNHSLFSDILQKFSSHASRLGLKSMEII